MELISREEAKRKIIEELDSIDHVPSWVFRRLERVISSLPIIEERKEGEWIDAGWDGEKCSLCGWNIDDTYYSKQFKYCPNCGAYMKGE